MNTVRGKLVQKMPENLKGLVKLAYNLWWSWTYDARQLFKLLDPPLWYKSSHNPVHILRNITPQRLEKMSKNSKFLALYEKVYNKFITEMQLDAELWWKKEIGKPETQIAYLSMEYGIHNSLKIFSGGLGILSGDHLKESSDLGIPIVAVGFLYQEGYFIQKISQARNGWQEEIYEEADFNDIPIEELIDPTTNRPFLIPIQFMDTTIHVKIWLVEVGRVKLYLIDSNIGENPPWYRDLTDRLYGGGSELRLKQEMILGLGSVRLFNKLGIKPTVWHLNEGHCSFSSIERIINYLEKGKTFEEALELIRKCTLFTTHTPVPAGHDVFPFRLIDIYFSHYLQQIGHENFYSLGSYDFGHGAGFNMTVLGMRTSSYYNAVSKLHREVSEKMFEPLWVSLREKYGEKFNPLTYVTNGTHAPSFVSGTFQELFNMVNENWVIRHDDPKIWDDMFETITDHDIWEFHRSAKLRMIRLIREVSRNKRRSGEWDSEMALVNGALFDPDVLTIGFARRFATYKRATLVFTDIERLKRLVNDPYRPVQLIFAGKAHPADDPGKKFIQDIINHAKNPELGHRIAFIENYDLVVAKMMLQGVDVWLNNPLRPNEASGTSGMKAAMNFVPNLSILDGWWDEGYINDPENQNGWAINPKNVEEPNIETQNWRDARSLYDILEQEIIPKYYDFEPGNIPYEWIKIMRNALKSNLPRFSSRRMLKDYSRNLYSNLCNMT